MQGPGPVHLQGEVVEVFMHQLPSVIGGGQPLATLSLHLPPPNLGQPDTEARESLQQSRRCWLGPWNREHRAPSQPNPGADAPVSPSAVPPINCLVVSTWGLNTRKRPGQAEHGHGASRS